MVGIGTKDEDAGEPDGAGALFVKGLGRANGITGGGLSLLAGVLLSQLTPEASVPMWFGAVAGIVLLTLLSALTMALLGAVEQGKRAYDDRNRYLPKIEVTHVSGPFSPHSQCRCVLIVAWSGTGVMDQGGAVLVSIAEDEFERPLGYGTVRGRQSDGKHVVTLDTTHQGADEYVEKLLDAHTHVGLLPRIRLGGTIVPEHLEAVRQHATTNPTGGVGATEKVRGGA